MAAVGKGSIAAPRGRSSPELYWGTMAIAAVALASLQPGASMPWDRSRTRMR